MDGTSTIIGAVFAIFTAIAEWFVETLPTFFTLFYAQGALTILGVLSLCGLGIGLVVLLFMMIMKAFQFSRA